MTTTALGERLVGVAEIAQMVKPPVTTDAVHKWRSRDPDFPEPEARLIMGDVYLRSKVERFLRRTGRLNGQPRRK